MLTKWLNPVKFVEGREAAGVKIIEKDRIRFRGLGLVGPRGS
jgi:hypothetical protein